MVIVCEQGLNCFVLPGSNPSRDSLYQLICVSHLCFCFIQMYVIFYHNHRRCSNLTSYLACKPRSMMNVEVCWSLQIQAMFIPPNPVKGVWSKGRALGWNSKGPGFKWGLGHSYGLRLWLVCAHVFCMAQCKTRQGSCPARYPNPNELVKSTRKRQDT